jgi:predicted O-methyltransferase YrrM
MNEAHIREHLNWMEQNQTGLWNVAPAEGQYLCDLVGKLSASRVLEIGASNGYSTVWLAMGVARTGGELISLEADTGRHRMATENLEHCGLSQHVRLHLGDAQALLATLDGPFDLVLIDAWKEDYPIYLKAIEGKVRAGGLILAHNMESHKEELAGFRDLLLANPRLQTEFVNLGPGGFSVSSVLGSTAV